LVPQGLSPLVKLAIGFRQKKDFGKLQQKCYGFRALRQTIIP